MMKKNHKLTTLTTALLITLATSSALQATADYFSPTDVGSSARMIRLGNIDGFNDMAPVIFENPAGMYAIRKGSVSLFTATLMGDLNYQNLAIAARMPVGMLGIGYASQSVPGLIKTTEITTEMGADQERYFVEDGSFTYSRSLTKISYQLSHSRNIHYGASLLIHQTSLSQYSGSGYNVEGGLIIEQSKNLTYSFVMRNILSSLKVNFKNSEDSSYSGTENLPLESVNSVRYKWNNFDIYGQLKITGTSRKLLKSLGVEYSPGFLPYFHISAGYKEVPVAKITKNDMSMGVGIDLYGFSFDYAFEKSDHVEFDQTHFFSIAFKY